MVFRKSAPKKTSPRKGKKTVARAQPPNGNLNNDLFFIPFTKMHGLGNDFVVIDGLRGGPQERFTLAAVTPDLARRIGHRQFGVGFDQLLWLMEASPEAVIAGDAHARMIIYNPDGSEAEMCGNGIRAAALYLRRYHPALVEAQPLCIETKGGLKQILFTGTDSSRVDMGAPRIGGRDEEIAITSAKGLSGPSTNLRFDEISMGNPHAVVWVPSLAAAPAEQWGPELEVHPRFPGRTNVEFVEKISESEIRVRVWERGAGFTLACGTGACASAVSGLLRGALRSPVRVALPGGVLTISWSGGSTDPVFMEGPATEVFFARWWLRG